jgi:hypothetical protein
LLAVALQAPVASAVVEAISMPPSKTFTTAPASAVPRKVTSLALVAVPTAVPSAARFTSTTGEATGGVASTVTTRTSEAALVLPASSVTVVAKV